MKRVVIFAHYDRDDQLDDYVLYYLQQLKSISECLVFVTTSNISKDAVNKLDDICSRVVVRENTGHDFMSYKVGLDHIDLFSYDELVLCNDSVYGPLYPLVDLFKTMERGGCSFWGVTQSLEKSYHVQSYFLVFRKNVLISSCFLDFWQNITYSKNKKQIIRDGEIGLSRTLIKNGFKAKVVVEYEPGWKDCLRNFFIVDHFFSHLILILKILLKGGWSKCNITHVFWNTIILNYKMPFIKIDLLRDNYMNLLNVAQYKEVVQRAGCDYPVEIIEKHLARMISE